MNAYMYEILEDYQSAQSKAKQEEIFTSFCQAVWENPNKRVIQEIPVTFRVKPALRNTEIGRIFSAYTCIPRISCPSVAKSADFASLIRQKANNLYSRYFDSQICDRKEYLDFLRIPKQLYFQWEASVRNPSVPWTLSPQELTDTLSNAMKQAQSVKETCAREKMELSWTEFQQVTEGFFRRLFEHYRPLDEYQDGKKLTVYAGAWNEDNFCVRYFCNGLAGYFKNYQKKYYGLYNVSSSRGLSYGRCACGSLFLQNKQRNRKLCDDCRKTSRLHSYSRYNQKRG